MKSSLSQRLPLWLAAFWWASLGMLGFLVVPLLFIHLPSAAQAGQMAAKLFTAQAWVGVVCTTALLLISRSHQAASPGKAGIALVWVLLGLLLALLGEFAIAPRIVSARALAGAGSGGLKLWHSVGSALYLVQWVCAGVALWRLSTPVAGDGGAAAAGQGNDPS